MNITGILLGIVGLYIGGNWVVAATSRLAKAFGFSQLIVGLTVISFVTTVPELLISVRASSLDANGLVMGTITGSNIANIGLILGLSGLIIGELPIATGVIRRGVPIMVGASLAIYGLLFLPELNWIVGLILVIGFILFSIYMLPILRRDQNVKQMVTQEIAAVQPIQTHETLLAEDEEIVKKEMTEYINRTFEMARAIGGIFLLVFASDLLVNGSLIIVQQLGTNEVVIGATFIALVTSLPEMVAITAANKRKQTDVIFGNLVGSAIANLLLVLGTAAIVQPITVAPQVRLYAYPVMIALMLYMIVVVLDGKLSRLEAGMYSLAYVAFIAGFFFLPFT